MKISCLSIKLHRYACKNYCSFTHNCLVWQKNTYDFKLIFQGGFNNRNRPTPLQSGDVDQWKLLWRRGRKQFIHFLHLQFHSQLWNSDQTPSGHMSTSLASRLPLPLPPSLGDRINRERLNNKVTKCCFIFNYALQGKRLRWILLYTIKQLQTRRGREAKEWEKKPSERRGSAKTPANVQSI